MDKNEIVLFRIVCLWVFRWSGRRFRAHLFRSIAAKVAHLVRATARLRNKLLADDERHFLGAAPFVRQRGLRLRRGSLCAPLSATDKDADADQRADDEQRADDADDDDRRIRSRRRGRR